MIDFFSGEVLENLIESTIAIAVLVLVYFVVKIIIDARTKKLKRGKKLTYLRLLRSVVKYILIIIGVLLVLQANGVDTGSIIAGLGIASVIAGLALQDALKDIIMGFNLIADNYFTAGDVIKVNDITGKVIEIGLKATKLKNLDNNNIETIANRNIGAASVVSKWFDIDVPLPYEEDLKKMEKFLGGLCEKIKQLPDVEDANYKGISDFESSDISYKLRLLVKPDTRFQTARDARCIIKQELDKEKLSIPYQTFEIRK